MIFYKNCLKPVPPPCINSDSESSVAVVPYIQGVMKAIKGILGGFNVKDSPETFGTLDHMFAKPKDRIAKEQLKDAIYSIPCNDCNQEYIGQTKR